MITVTKFARTCGVSRGTVLYYESIGLLKRPPRSASNYRRYGAADVRRLAQIRVYREAGLTLEDIRALLDGPRTDVSAVLERRIAEINAEIQRLHEHQRAIARLLRHRQIFKKGQEMITKDKWVSIMKAAGFSQEDMHRWHREFERSAPAEHQEFLEFLRIAPEEIDSIRAWSRRQEEK